MFKEKNKKTFDTCPIQYPRKNYPRCSEGGITIKIEDKTLAIKVYMCD